MKIRPIKSYKKPEYPNISEFSKNASDLSKRSPRRWKKNAAIASILTSILINVSCDTNDNNTNRKYEINSSNFNKIFNKELVSPIFEHGDGFSCYGCMVSAPPVFISEADAKMIILSELNKNLTNCEFSKNDNKDFSITMNELQGNLDSLNSDKSETKRIKFDYYDSKLNLAILYLSKAKYDSFGIIPDRSSTAIVENYKEIAINIRKKLSQEQKFRAAIFYEPVCQFKFKELQILENDNTLLLALNPGHFLIKKDADSLRAQVRDYVKWLKKL